MVCFFQLQSTWFSRCEMFQTRYLGRVMILVPSQRLTPILFCEISNPTFGAYSLQKVR